MCCSFVFQMTVCYVLVLPCSFYINDKEKEQLHHTVMLVLHSLIVFVLVPFLSVRLIELGSIVSVHVVCLGSLVGSIFSTVKLVGSGSIVSVHMVYLGSLVGPIL